MEVNYQTLIKWLNKIEKTYDLLFDLDDCFGHTTTFNQESIDKALYDLSEIIDMLNYLCENASNEEKGIHARGYKQTPVSIATIKTTLKIDPQSKMTFLTPELSKENIISLAQVAFDFANVRGLEGDTVRNLQYKYDDVGTELTVECIRED